MNRKNMLFALFIFLLSTSFIPRNVKGELKRFDLPPHMYYGEEVEAGTMDLISWNFECDGRIDLYLLSHDDYQFFETFSFTFVIEEVGEKLAGHSRKASGQFTPEHADTWYFVFLNAEDEPVNLRYEINNFENYYIIVPTLIVFAIIAAGGFGFYVYTDQKKKKKQQVQPTSVQPQQQVVQQAVPQRTQDFVLEFCPACGSKVMNKNAKFCDNCAHEFRK